MRRRRFLHLLWIVPLLLILAAAGYLYYRYTTFKKPYAADIETDLIVPHDMHTAKISHVFKLVNENDIRLHIDSVYYSVYLDGEKYAEGKQTKDFTIEANDTSDVEMGYTFDLDKFLKNYEGKGKDSALHSFRFDFYADIWKFNSVHIPYTYEKRMAVFKRPTAEIRKIKLTKFGLKESTIDAEIYLHNPSDIMYDATSFRYSLKVEGTEIAEGKINKEKILRRESSLFLSVPIKVEVLNALKEAEPFKKGSGEKGYVLAIHIELNPPPEKNVPTFDLDLVRAGKVSELVEDYKEERAEMKAEKKEEKKKR